MRGWERNAPPAQRQAGAASARPPALQLLVADPLRPSRGSRFPRAGFRLHRLVEEPKDRREALPGGQLVPLRPCNTERAPRHYLLEIREIGVGVCVCGEDIPRPQQQAGRVKLGSGSYTQAPAAQPSPREHPPAYTRAEDTRSLQAKCLLRAGIVIVFPGPIG